MIEFDWDPAKAKRNLNNHGLSLDEAKSVFFDDFAWQFYDEAHSEQEGWFLLLGVSNTSRILFICHCELGDRSTIQFISARKATAKESQLYDGPIP